MKKLLPILTACVLFASHSNAQIIDTTQCSKIVETSDRFSNERTFSTPYGTPCSLEKVIGNKTAYYLLLKSGGSTISVFKKGVKLILSNNQVVSFPNEDIDQKVSENGEIEYSAFVIITPAVLSLLKKYNISGWKLYVYEGWQDDATASILRAQINCLSSQK